MDFDQDVALSDTFKVWSAGLLEFVLERWKGETILIWFESLTDRRGRS